MRKAVPEEIRIQQISELQNIEFIEWDGEYKNAKSKAKLRCAVDGFCWSSSVDSLVNHKVGCPQCSGHRRWTANERISQIGSIEGISFISWVGKFSGNLSKANVKCDLDGFTWSVSVDSLIHHRSGYPKCNKHGFNKSKVGYLYALRSECGGMVKIGISNNYHARHEMLKKKTPFKWSCIELADGDGDSIARLERRIHNMTEAAEFLNIFDGYTEWRKWDERIPSWFSSINLGIDI